MKELFLTSNLAAMIALVIALVFATPAPAQPQTRSAVGTSVQKMAKGALGVLDISVIPNESASTLFLDSSSGDDYNFRATQFGAAFTVSENTPIYMEGFAGASRYDPTFLFSGLTHERKVRAKWTSFAATGGLGWDFRLTEHLVFRPIANISLGAVISDATIAQAVLNDVLGTDIKFIENGTMYSFGYGGSAMLDYEYKSREYEIDSELRFSHICLQNFGAPPA